MSEPRQISASDAASLPQRWRIGSWWVDTATGELVDGETHTTLEPRLMALLCLLAQTPGQVMSREHIETTLWPDVVVGEDTVARAISRLRRALGDSAQSSRYIETLPKRGYRLIATVEQGPEQESAQKEAGSWVRRFSWVGVAILAVSVLWWQLRPSPPDAPAGDPDADQVARADDLYMRFTRADNEAAIGLYERVLARQPDNYAAQAGLANALVQRIVRWPRGQSAEGVTTLTDALDQGLTSRPEARAVLARAVAMAERAVDIAPSDPGALKALAFTYTAQGELERAAALYKDVIALDSDAWAAMINLGEIFSMRGDTVGALDYFEQAWNAMARAYDYEPQRVGRWQVPFGVLIGQMHEQLDQPADAELWYRRVLAQVPYEPEATVHLARLLAASGERAEAQALCDDLRARIGVAVDCDIQP